MTSPAPLDYAPAPPLQRRRWFRRTVMVAFMLSLAGITWRWGPEKWQRAKLLYWQRQCLNYSQPADEVVYDQDPTRDSAWAKQPGYRATPLTSAWYPSPHVAAAKYADCLNPLMAVVDRSAQFQAYPVVFMHERRALSGNPYLVVVVGRPDHELNGKLYPLDFTALPIRPGTWTDTPSNESFEPVYDDMTPIRQPLPVRMFAGQVDAVDASHFTFIYEVAGTRHVIDGYVEDGFANFQDLEAGEASPREKPRPSDPLEMFAAQVRLTER